MRTVRRTMPAQRSRRSSTSSAACTSSMNRPRSSTPPLASGRGSESTPCWPAMAGGLKSARQSSSLCALKQAPGGGGSYHLQGHRGLKGAGQGRCTSVRAERDRCWAGQRLRPSRPLCHWSWRPATTAASFGFSRCWRALLPPPPAVGARRPALYPPARGATTRCGRFADQD
jgi:hypothetical protein